MRTKLDFVAYYLSLLWSNVFLEQGVEFLIPPEPLNAGLRYVLGLDLALF